MAIPSNPEWAAIYRKVVGARLLLIEAQLHALSQTELEPLHPSGQRVAQSPEPEGQAVLRSQPLTPPSA